MTLVILRFILFSGLLYLAYRLLFSRLSFYKLNRGILLVIPVVSLLIPIIAPQFEAPQVSQPALQAMLHEVLLNAPAQQQPEASQGFNWWWVAYTAGASVVMLYVIMGFIRGWQILHKSTHAFDNIYFSQLARGPFAFFKNIVIPTDFVNSKKLQSVVAHEKAHVDQNHGFDNLYYNLLSALFWFNPFIHLLFRELRQTHECLADEAALKGTPRENYAQLLLSSAFGSEISFDSANRFFNSSLIKTRITMMYKTKTKQKMKALYLALLPLLAMMVVMSCQKTEEASNPPPAQEEKSAVMGLAEADQPPLFEQCDANASKEEQMACFQKGIMHYIMTNFKYPEKARKEKLEGKIFVKFTIDETGVVKDATVAHWKFKADDFHSSKSVENAETGEKSWKVKLDPVAQEAIDYSVELVKGLPLMAPALKDGKKVPVSFVLPINMQLN